MDQYQIKVKQLNTIAPHFKPSFLTPGDKTLKKTFKQCSISTRSTLIFLVYDLVRACNVIE